MGTGVGLLGCGTVGGGVVRLLRERSAEIAARVGGPVEIVRVAVRDAGKARAAELDPALLTTSAEELVQDPRVDVVVEVMGGIEPALALLRSAIRARKQIVTANKMLLAFHGPELFARARAASVDLAFEGSVGGGIPVIRTLREALASDSIASLTGIVNGTSNYVLTRMQRDGVGFDAVLRDAQEKGYAEADASLDVGGHDAAHKLTVLAMLAFGAEIDPSSVPTEGLADLEPVDLEAAHRFGYVIKPLAVALDRGEALDLRVHPALVPQDAPLASVGGVLNAIAIRGRAVGTCVLSGPGAGAMPTAVSVVADVIDVARAREAGKMGLLTAAVRTKPRPLLPILQVVARHYLRFVVRDEPGVLGRIATALGKAGVSIEELVQRGRGEGTGAPVNVVMMTHEARGAQIRGAVSSIDLEDFVVAKTRVLRVVESQEPVLAEG